MRRRERGTSKKEKGCLASAVVSLALSSVFSGNCFMVYCRYWLIEFIHSSKETTTGPGQGLIYLQAQNARVSNFSGLFGHCKRTCSNHTHRQPMLTVWGSSSEGRQRAYGVHSRALVRACICQLLRHSSFTDPAAEPERPTLMQWVGLSLPSQ